jgi:hypothetical protein
MEKFVIDKKFADELAIELKKNMVTQIRKTKSIATGTLLNSIKMDIVRTDDGGISVTLLDSEYIFNVDEGRRPGKYAPMKELENWVKRKGLAAEKKKVTAIAFAINNKIKREGIRPKRIISTTVDQTLPLFNKIADKIITTQLDNYLNELINK